MHGRLLAIGLAMLILIGCSLSAAQQPQTAPTTPPQTRQDAPQAPSGQQGGQQAPAATQAPAPGAGSNPSSQRDQGTQPGASSTTQAPQGLLRDRPAAPAPAPGQSQAAQGQTDLVELYRRTAPSVVYIAVRVAQGIGQGSGFIVDKQGGYIVTNNHVVEGAQQVRVEFFDKSAISAQVVGTDPDSDIAVIRVGAIPDSAPAVAFGDSDKVNVGERVIAIGNPFGREFSHTVTEGIVSALGRSLPSGQESQFGPGFSNPSIIQTDAAINPGNSGGPLFNMRGEVIGINTAIQSPSGSNSGIGFAVPVNQVKRVAPAIIAQGRYAHPYLGVQIDTATTTNQKGLEVPVGALIAGVTSGGPADRSGLRQNDIVTAVNGQQIFDQADLLAYLEANARPGQAVTMTIYRSNRQQDLQVTVGERPRQR
ncbi:MAG: trypsin-like peptidase domain-containing protein [Anaerolineae bacterium]|nr:trypsin-like peptidase domain-containing protein [Anaerolineae bacterium]